MSEFAWSYDVSAKGSSPTRSWVLNEGGQYCSRARIPPGVFIELSPAWREYRPDAVQSATLQERGAMTWREWLIVILLILSIVLISGFSTGWK